MTRYFLKIAYNGTNYSGWQIQKNAHSVQAEINKALALLIGNTVETVGCGRTDAGVHASDFYLHFDTFDEIVNSEDFVYKLNRILPKDVVCYSLRKVVLNAHARFDALARTYHYFLSSLKNPFKENTCAYFYGELNLELMNEACQSLFKHTDFTSFSKTGTQVNTNNCKIMEAYWDKNAEDELVFTIKADRFLRNMVRAIVGTMLEVGKKKLSLSDFNEVIESKNRSKAGTSVAACGLFLSKVEYPSGLFINGQ